jgi:hypothetical protein
MPKSKTNPEKPAEDVQDAAVENKTPEFAEPEQYSTKNIDFGEADDKRDVPDHLTTGTGDGISWHKEHRGISHLRTLSGRPQLASEPISDAEPRTTVAREAIPQTPWGAAADPARKTEEKVVKPGETAG